MDKIDVNRLSFAAINKNVLENIPTITEKKINSVDFVICGEDNKLFENYYNAYMSSPTLNSLVNGIVDYIVGSSCSILGMSEDAEVNAKGETLEEVLRKVATDYLIYGNAALDIIGNSMYHVSMRNLRSNEDNTVFYYTTNFNKSYGRLKTLVYPKYQGYNEKEHQIIFIKNGSSNTYGVPVYASALNSALIEGEVSKYFTNALYNGFMPSYLISFLNGIPSDQIKEEIEESFTEKFCGSNNASRVMLNFADDKDHALQVDKIETDAFADKYNSLIEFARQTLFTSFRAPRNLFAFTTDNKGFSEEEYNQSGLLFQRTVIAPIQKRFLRAINKFKTIEIKPFIFTEEVNKRDTIVE